MDYESIIYEVADGVATITLNRPSSLNAFNDQMLAELIDAFKQCARDSTVRCVAVTGSGRAFSAGQDLKDMQERGDQFSIGEHMRGGYNKLVRQITTLEKPVIAAVNGIAAGAGCGLALACDLRIASDKASFMLAFSNVGLIPDSGSTWTLPRLIGFARAYEMAITADKVSAETALEWGMINQIAPAEQLLEIVAAWATALASGPTLAYGLTKRAMYKANDVSLAEALEYESLLQEIAAGSHDSREGVRAFLEKREPAFTGE
jgi:2-(1,2-epoxy-1,2-dihydrophenyl)acetyl-CoA isomerase